MKFRNKRAITANEIVSHKSEVYIKLLRKEGRLKNALSIGIWLFIHFNHSMKYISASLIA